MDLLIQMILWITAIAQIVVAVMSFINGGLARRTIIASLTMLTGAAWTIILSTSWALDDTNIYFVNQLVMLVGMLMYYMISLLGLSFTEIKSKIFYPLALLFSMPAVCMAIAITFRINLFIPDVQITADDVILTTNPFGLLLIALTMVVYVGLGIANLILARKQANTVLGRKLIRNVIIGFVLAFISPLVFNVANAEVHELHPLGPIGLLAMAILTYSALVSHGDDEL